VPRGERELLILPEFMSSPPICSGVRVVQSLVFCAVFCRSCFVVLFFYHIMLNRVLFAMNGVRTTLVEIKE
jgi:hypothetical protein